MSVWRQAALVAALAILSLAAGAQEPAAPSQAGEPAADLNPLHGLAKDSLRDFRDRPLFAPSRRAPSAPEPVEQAEAEPAAPPEPPAPAEAPKLRLTGVIEGPEESVAVVEDLTAESTVQLRLGDMVDGWLVSDIESVTLKLTLGERDEEYRLFDPERPQDAARGPAR